MASLRGQAAGVEDARRAWGESMARRLAELRLELEGRQPDELATRSGAELRADAIRLVYWGRPVQVSWPALQAIRLDDGQPCSTFDTAMLLYYLVTADGTPMADRWIGFRELPDGAFYNQAFQGYSGAPLARATQSDPDRLERAAAALDGRPVGGLAPFAYRFQPLPRVPLAAALWPGDEDLPGRAAVLFDASASHYLTTDGLALMGSGLTSRLLRAADNG